MPTGADLLNPAPAQPAPAVAAAGPNPFDQFDGHGANPFDKFDAAPQSQRSTGQAVATGFGKGTRDIIHGGADVLDFVPDAAKALWNLPGDVAQIATGHDLGKRAPYHSFRNASDALADHLGLPTDENATDRVLGAGLEGAIAGVGIGGAMGALKAAPGAVGALGKALAGSSAVNAGAGAAGGAASQGTAEAGGGPIAQLLAGTGAAMMGGYGAGRATGEIAAPTVDTSKAKPQGPLAKALAPYVAAVSKGAAAKQAGAAIASRATNLDAVTAALDQPHEILPGYEPTTYQQTGDQGLGQLERQVRTPNEAPFQERAAEQNAARRAVMDNVETGGNPIEVANGLKQQMDDMNARHQASVDAIHNDAEAKASQAVGPAEHDDSLGAELRASLDDADEAHKQETRGLFNAAIPDNKMTGNMLATSQGAHDILADVPESAKKLDGENAAVFEAAKALPPIAPLRELVALRYRVTDAMSSALRDGDAQAHRLLVQLRGKIEDNLSHSIAQEVANQHPHVVEGRLTGSDALVNRLQSWIQQSDGATTSSAAQRGGNGGGVQAEQGLGGSPVDDAGALGANRAAAERPGSPAGNPGVSPADLEAAQADLERYRAPNPNSLFSAIRKAGGLRTRDPTGARLAGPDVEAALTDVHRGLINNQSGLSGERVAQALADNGWFGPNPGDPSAAFEAALSREARGSKVFHPEDTYNAESHRRLEADIQASGIKTATRGSQADVQTLASYRVAIREMRAIAEASGITGADRMTPQELLTDLQEREAIRAEGSANEAPNEHAAEFDRLSGGGPLKPTVDAEAKARLDLANESSKVGKQTFGKGPVGEVLKTNGFKGDFRLSNGDVAAKFFRPRPDGFERMQALLKTGAKDVLPTIERFAMHTLRRIAMRADGTLDPVKYAKWAKDYAQSLRALPAETRAKFADAAKASEALADAQGAHAAALKEAQAGVLGKVMGASEPEDVTRKVGQAMNSVADMKTLAKATAPIPAARLGLRRAIAEHIASKFVSNTEVAGSGLTGIKSDGYQTFIREHRAAMHLVFSPEEVRSMEAVAESLQQAARSNTTKAPASPGTAQDTALQKAGKAAGHSWMQVVGGIVGATHGGPEMAVLGAGFGHGLSSLNRSIRAAGIANVNDAVTTAVLHPAVARELIKKVPRQTTHLNVAAMPLNAALWAAGQPRKDAKP